MTVCYSSTKTKRNCSRRISAKPTNKPWPNSKTLPSSAPPQKLFDHDGKSRCNGNLNICCLACIANKGVKICAGIVPKEHRESLLLGFILRDKIGHQSQKKSEFIFHEFFDSTMSYLLLSFADAKYAMDKEIVLTQNSVANAVRSCSSC